MSSEKNITMRQFNGTDYDYLYPRTAVGQISGLSDNYYNKNESNGLYLRTDGSNAMSGNINANNHYITNVVTGSSGGDAANKSYVDNQIGNTLYSVNIGYNGNVNGQYSNLGDGYSNYIVGSNSFTIKNVIGVLFSVDLICDFPNQQYATDYRIFANCMGAKNIYRGVSGQQTKYSISVQIQVFAPLIVPEYYYSNNTYLFYGSYVSTLPQNVPVNGVGIKFGYNRTTDANPIVVHSGVGRIDVIYHR